MKPRVVVLMTAALLAIGACGVPSQSDPQAIPSDVIPAPLLIPSNESSPSASTSESPTPTPTPTPSSDTLMLWFVKEDGLVALPSALPEDSSADEVMAALAAGPDPAYADLGLRTIALDPITGTPLATIASVEPAFSAPASGPPVITEQISGVVVVQLSTAFTALPPAEQVLLLGQVVLTLTDAGAEAVAFTDESGTLLAVPLPDGRLLDLPASAADFRSLVTFL